MWKELGVTYALSQVLFEVAEYPDIIAKQLAKNLRLEKSTVSRFLAQLVRKRLIHLKTSSSDSRVRHIQLSDRGRALVLRINDLGNRKTKEALSGFSARDCAAIAASLKMLSAHLNDKSCL